ncbi:hypothetical protein O6H91_Y564600 [Diphasiastrum complanatum]|nr:hypothetical protein O6H91_Y564600 [Diphasiastrum complanatum]
MGYEEDYERDEEGQPIYDPDRESDRQASPEPPVDEDWQQEEARSPSPAPESDEEEDAAPKAKPRKRLIKKTVEEGSPENFEEVIPKQRIKGSSSGGGEGLKKVRKPKEAKSPKEGKKRKPASVTAEKLSKVARGSGKADRASTQRGERKGDKEMKEMWDSVVGGDSEDDVEGEKTREDEAFIDDTGVEPDERYVSDDEAGSVGAAPQAEEGEEDDELNSIFKPGKKKRKSVDRTPEETAMLVEQFMARLEVAAEEDAEFNRQSKPAINKLKLLPALVNVLEKRQLQQEFLDRGILSVLKNWLEPLPDGSLPNINIRSAILKLLTELPIDVELYDRREQLKKSGLGKVVMFLSRLDEETPLNKKLARDLVDKWSRPIFQKSTRYEDLRTYDEEKPLPRRTPAKKQVIRPTVDEDLRGDELDLEDQTQELRPGQSGYRYHASRPEAVPLDFLVRPASKVDAEDIRARAKQQKQDEKRAKMNKKLQQLRTPKGRKLQAERISVEGRGLVKFF